MKISVVTAAENEARTIRGVVMDSRKYADEVLVLDGHSDDETASQAAKAGARQKSPE